MTPDKSKKNYQIPPINELFTQAKAITKQMSDCGDLDKVTIENLDEYLSKHINLKNNC